MHPGDAGRLLSRITAYDNDMRSRPLARYISTTYLCKHIRFAILVLFLASFILFFYRGDYRHNV